MCGIAGRFSWIKPPERLLIQQMTQSLAHRGPDAEGIYLNGPIGLGHRRLAIIDTNHRSNQPMADISGRFHIVFNGEIYNFQEIRQTLKNLGSRFQTNSDTEVILESYKQWGEHCLNHFNGMFAFALWDEKEKSLLLARDRLGKKPLFYHLLPEGGIIFASELKALIKDPDLKPQINPKALSHYLTLNHTLTNTSILKNVHKLAPGHFLTLSQNKTPHIESYWDLAHCFHEKQTFKSENEAVEAYSSLFDDAVRLRLVSDVPLGAFLSGGVDSSAIVAAMARLGKPFDVQTFSIGFSEKGFSETDKARRVANILGVQYQDQILDSMFTTDLSDLAFYGDEPFADTSILPMFRLAAFARKKVTVALSGDGADEIFAGYTTYTADQIHHLSQWIPSFGFSALEWLINRYLPVTFGKVSLDYKIRKFINCHGQTPQQAHFSWRTIFSSDEKQQLVVPEIAKEILEADPFDSFDEHYQAVRSCHYLDQAMYVDIKTWLADDILVKVDRSTMAHGLEARAPFLDYRLVEFAASLPIQLKMKGFQRKYLLKKSLAGAIPKDILKQKKEGFNAPISHWLLDHGDELFSNVSANLGGGLFRQEKITDLWQEHRCKKRDNGLLLFGLLMFDLWQRRILS